MIPQWPLGFRGLGVVTPVPGPGILGRDRGIFGGGGSWGRWECLYVARARIPRWRLLKSSIALDTNVQTWLPLFPKFVLEALSEDETMECLASLWEDYCLLERCCLRSPTLLPVNFWRSPYLRLMSSLEDSTWGEVAGSVWGGRSRS